MCVIALFRPGMGATEIDPGLCDGFSPENFRETMDDHMDAIDGEIRQHIGNGELIGHGPSAGGVFMAAMALGGLFERVQFTDAFYLPVSEEPEAGVSRFLEYLKSGERSKPFDPNTPTLPPEKDPVGVRTAARQGKVEIAHYAPLLLSAVGASMAYELANSSPLPMHIVHIGHTFTGSTTEASQFGRELEAIRGVLNTNLRHPDSRWAAELRVTDMPDMWHSDLSLRPDIMAGLLQQTLELDGLT